MCSVIPVENGHQAWAYLQDTQSNIDLVLTEVFMHGGLSGIDLLGRIMNHEVCKDIPVISKQIDRPPSALKCFSTMFICSSAAACIGLYLVRFQ